MSNKDEVKKSSVDKLAADLTKCTPAEARAITGGKSDRIDSESAHRIAAETQRNLEKKQR